MSEVSEIVHNIKMLTLEEFNELKQKKIWSHVMILGHFVVDLEQTMKIAEHTYPEKLDFETWVCMNHKCNYFEYRLKEGHREDR